MSAPEFHLQKSICELLDVAYPQVVYFSVPNGAVLGWSEAERKRAGREMSKLKVTGLKPGAPDLCVIGPGGVLCGLEVKSPTGTLSESQRAFRHALEGAGGNYLIVRSLDDVRVALAYWGIRGCERAA